MTEQTGYLDFHSHILPGVDDGAETIEETQKMLMIMYAQGVRTAVATPHNYPGGHRQDNQKMRRLCAQADQMAQEIDPQFRVLPGNEVFYRDSICEEIEREEILTMADSRYLLVEFAPTERMGRIRQGMQNLLQEGYYPVIAHIERVSCLIGAEENVAHLVEMGCYMQVNCQSLIKGRWDMQSRRLQKMVEKGLVHFLGSDCHHEKQRPPVMQDCVAKLYKSLPEKAVNRLLMENKEHFLKKEYI